MSVLTARQEIALRFYLQRRQWDPPEYQRYNCEREDIIRACVLLADEFLSVEDRVGQQQ